MKKILASILGVLAFFGCGSSAPAKTEINGKPIHDVTVYDFTMKSLEGKEVALANYKGKVLIMVNVASKCGLTPQYKDIEAFYKENHAKGIEVLGFPANNFMGQEPGTNEEIQSFCSKNYGVTFPMFDKISVKGEDMHPLYQYLTSITQTPVSWNFQKFLISKEGKVVKSFSPRTSILDKEVLAEIEALSK